MPLHSSRPAARRPSRARALAVPGYVSPALLATLPVVVFWKAREAITSTKTSTSSSDRSAVPALVRRLELSSAAFFCASSRRLRVHAVAVKCSCAMVNLGLCGAGVRSGCAGWLLCSCVQEAPCNAQLPRWAHAPLCRVFDEVAR